MSRGRSITNVSKKATERYTKMILSGEIQLEGRTPCLLPATGSTASWKDGDYIPSRDNPQSNIRPGADDHKRYASKGVEAQVTYRRGHA